jgi:hypothetical protein
MKAHNIDYFYVTAGVRKAGDQNWHTSVACKGKNLEHTIIVLNTGHFDADVWPMGEIAQPGKGMCFPSGQQWTALLDDLRQNEQRPVSEAIDLSKSHGGDDETMRSGILQYTDRSTNKEVSPLTPLPISEIVKII